MRLTDIPVFIDFAEYDGLMKNIADRFSGCKEINAIYKIGSVSTPGISDLDLVFVFDNDVKFNLNVRKHLSGQEKYILVHNPFGIAEKHFETHIHNFSHGNVVTLYSKSKSGVLRKSAHEYDKTIRVQNALEYLIKFFLTLSIQISRNTLKVRSLLLEIKALKFDFDVLGYSGNNLTDNYNNLLELRNEWFRNSNNEEHFISLIKSFYSLITDYIEILLNNYSFFLPCSGYFKYSNNISFLNSTKLEFTYRGFGRYFSSPATKPELYLKFVNRFSNYTLNIPWKNPYDVDNKIMINKFKFEKELMLYNKSKIPFFLVLKTPFVF